MRSGEAFLEEMTGKNVSVTCLEKKMKLRRRKLEILNVFEDTWQHRSNASA